MVLFNNTDKEMSLKLVYVGCAVGGKTTTLEQIHQGIQGNQRSRLFSLNTANDRTLFFDLLPLELGHISGYSVKLQLFTVPGQVQYGSTRRAVLSGVDAVVMVVDSTRDRLHENELALRELAEHLDSHDLNIRRIPLVLQFNKRDLPNVLPVSVLEKSLNKNRWHSYETVAVKGIGVFDPFLTAVQLLATDITERYRFVSSFPERLLSSLKKLLPAPVEAPPQAAANPDDDVLMLGPSEADVPSSSGQAPSPGNAGLMLELDTLVVEEDRKVSPLLRPPGPGDSSGLNIELPQIQQPQDRQHFRASVQSVNSDQALMPEQLVQGAVEANVAMAQLNTKLERTEKRLQERVGQLADLARLARLISAKPAMADILNSNFKVILKSLQASGGAVLVPEGGGPSLKEFIHEGFPRDPLNSLACKDFPSVAAGLYQRGRSSAGPSGPNKMSPIDKQLERWSIISHLCQPLVAHGQQFGIMCIYRSEPAAPFDKADMAFFSAMVALTSLALRYTAS